MYIPWEFHTNPRFNGHSCCPKTGFSWFPKDVSHLKFVCGFNWACFRCWTWVRFRIPSQRCSFQTWWNDPKPAIAGKLMGKPLATWWVSRLFFFVCLWVYTLTTYKCCSSCLSVKFVQKYLCSGGREYGLLFVYLSLWRFPFQQGKECWDAAFPFMTLQSGLRPTGRDACASAKQPGPLRSWISMQGALGACWLHQWFTCVLVESFTTPNWFAYFAQNWEVRGDSPWISQERPHN